MQKNSIIISIVVASVFIFLLCLICKSNGLKKGKRNLVEQRAIDSLYQCILEKNREFTLEIQGKGGSGVIGFGPVAQSIRHELRSLEYICNIEKKEINDLLIEKDSVLSLKKSGILMSCPELRLCVE